MADAIPFLPEPPDTSGTLTQEQRTKIQEWLKKHWRGQIGCPISGHNSWIIGDHIVAPPIQIGGGITIGRASYPQIMLICNECGYTIYFNAVKIGLTPSVEK